ncbi:uncharacterized protein BDCG_16845 [Blastomyces dermatitidis ER-3]|uniref:Uncharacterized protein n=2 Tax=Ajellomyces dermatitidis TaxID=5039 RepID=A0A0J9ERF7_AJEDA|nr:uncharacterized protein BDCG_16845 [Blastomyces dermatitidis ER-3]KMW67750.1 hypothetical protein BDDG_12295 [Blastomyces dermatitidis ATCC 18188]OAT01012.1 hypothetical protein BDCG_16845 [Blastomyces dermatitidis ER-3]
MCFCPLPPQQHLQSPGPFSTTGIEAITSSLSSTSSENFGPATFSLDGVQCLSRHCNQIFARILRIPSPASSSSAIDITILNGIGSNLHTFFDTDLIAWGTLQTMLDMALRPLQPPQMG